MIPKYTCAMHVHICYVFPSTVAHMYVPSNHCVDHNLVSLPHWLVREDIQLFQVFLLSGVWLLASTYPVLNYRIAQNFRGTYVSWIGL